jgi:mRNA interferase MazF
MIKQGDIIFIGLDPALGHEQKGRRPVVVVSNNDYNKATSFRVVYPISNTDRAFALYVKLDERTKTTGVILADQLRTIDISARQHSFVEGLPEDILDKVLEIAQATVAK